MVPFYIYIYINARSVDHLWQREVVGTVGVGKGNACVRLNLRKNRTFSLQNAGKAEGFCTVQRAHSTDTSVVGCLQGFSESGVDEEV